MSFTTESSKYNLKLSDLPYIKVNNLNLSILNVSGNSIKSSWKDYLDLSVERIALLTVTRDFDVRLGITTNIKKDIEKSPFDVCLGIDVDRIANAGQIMGDIRFYDTALNEGNYSGILTPYGYGRWRELVTGEYIYQGAICKYCMQSSLNADRPNTRQYVHKVDVPDIIDTGTATLTKTNQPLFVRFSDEEVRRFHVVPELNVNIKSYGGTGATPLVIPYNVTREGFYVTMKVDGAYVDGTISYSARGY